MSFANDLPLLVASPPFPNSKTRRNKQMLEVSSFFHARVISKMLREVQAIFLHHQKGKPALTLSHLHICLPSRKNPHSHANPREEHHKNEIYAEVMARR